jgi:hypothetical protein
MIEDCALEHNRRVAWARYYQTRRDMEALQLLAAELAEWVEVTNEQMPAPLQQLVTMVRADLAPRDLAVVRRYVAHHARAA